MKKTNKLISIILAFLMLTSLVPAAVFAEGNPVAKIGDTEYKKIEDAFKASNDMSSPEIELLDDAVYNDLIQQSARRITVNMKGHCIKSSFRFLGGTTRKFNDGTIVGNFEMWSNSTAEVILTAPADAEYAVDGGVSVPNGSMTISGAKVGLRGTLNASSKLDISGSVKAVELTAEPTIGANYEVLGSADGSTPTQTAVYDSTRNTYTVNGDIATKIVVSKINAPEPDTPILSKDGVQISTTSQNPITIYAGQSITFDITYTSNTELSTYIQKSATNFDISATIANDKKSVTITTKKDSKPNTYKVSVFPKDYQSKKSANVYIKISDAPCDHKENGAYSINSEYVCTKCNAQMVASVEKAGTADYYDNLQDAADSTPASGNPEDCTLTLLKSVNLTDYLSIYGKTFTYIEAKDAKLEFANTSHFMSINDDNGNPSNIVIDSIDNSASYNVYIKEIYLRDKSKLTTKENTTIGELSIKSNDVSFDLGGEVSNLGAYIPGNDSKKLVEFLNEDTAYYNYATKTWVSSRDANCDTLENVTMKTRPFKNFSVNSYSSTLYYPSTNYVTFKYEVTDPSSFNYIKAKITAKNLPSADNFAIERTENKVLYCKIQNLPAGEYEIPFTLEYDGYTETTSLAFTVLPCPVAESSNITVKINDKTDDFVFPYARGEQELTVKVFDKSTDITDNFIISGNTVKDIGKYDITIKAKDNANYSGTITKQVTISPIYPTRDVDYTVVEPTNLKYDGNPKEYQINAINNSGITSEAKEVTLAYRKDGFSIPSAPTLPGDYVVAINVKESIGNYRGSYFGDLDTFTIEKADSEFEFTGLKDTYQYEESAKIKVKIKKAGENATAPSGKITVYDNTAPIFSVRLAEAELKNGEFEFDWADLTSYLVAGTYTFLFKYSGDDRYTAAEETKEITITKTPITFDVSNTEHRYAPATERKITFKPTGSSKLTEDDFIVRYYLVDENSGKLASVNPVEKTISAGRYLYVISFKKDETEEKYELNGNIFKGSYTGVLNDTSVPNISDYANIGFMDIKAASEVSQKPISFKKGIVSLKQSNDFVNANTLVNENNSTVTYESSDETVAAVDADGKIKAVKSGTATITAISTMEGATPVYASYTVNVKKELTKDSFEIKAVTKIYDEKATASVTAVLTDKSDENDVVNVSVTATFENADAGKDKNISYEITGISGKDADKYILSDVSDNLKGTVKGTIEKAPVSIMCAKVTSRTYDGSVQTADVSAMANGKIFDSSNYTVKYGGEDAVSSVGEYKITIVLNSASEKNYYVLPFEAKLKITNAAQDVFSIENIPENVYYGDKFTVKAMGANGDVTYAVTSGADVAAIDENSGEVTINDVGTVTITATSTKDGYANKTAVRTFAAKPRILTPVVKQTENKEYDGSPAVKVKIELNNVLSGTESEIDTYGTMLTSDAGSEKIVYISLSNTDLADSKHYTLSTNSLQATVNVTPIKISDFKISAYDKKYDGSKSAQAEVTEISDILAADKDLVSIVGNAEFDSADASENKQNVTFTASSLTGAKAANYTLGKTSAAAEAYIKPLEVKFTIGQTSFVYDGSKKEAAVSAVDENGRIFTEFDVSYDKEPVDAGDYTASIDLRGTPNYYTNQGSIGIKVAKATQDQLVIAGLPGTVEYSSEFKLSAFGGTDGGEILWNVTSGNASISKDGDVKVTGIGKIEIEAVKTSDNYKNVSAKVIFTAMPKNITFELSNLEQTYGEVSGVTVTPSDSDAADFEVTYNNSFDIPKNAGRYTVKVKTKGENYEGSASATFVINKAAVSGGEIIGINDSYTYGDVIGGAGVSGIPNGTSAKITYAGTGIYIPREAAPANAGKYTAIAEITGANYETLTLTKEFEIKKAPLTVKAEDKTRAYGEANPIFTLSYDGFKNNETKDVLLYEPNAVTSASASSAVGEYDINVSGGYAENYEFTYKPGKLTITGAQSSNLYITNLPGTVYVNNKFMLNAFYGNAKINAVWESSNPEIASVDANGNVTAKKAGTVKITATADSNYSNASASVEFTVKAANITLIPKDLVKVYNGQRQEIAFEDADGFTPVFSGEGKNVDVKYTLTTDPTVTEPINAGTYIVTYTVLGDGFAGGGTATMYINKATAEIKPKDITKIYGSKPEFEFETSNALVSEDELSKIAQSASFTSEGTAENAPVNDSGYDITAVLNDKASENISFVVSGTGKLTVTKAPLSITVKDVTREYSAENPVLEALYDGFVNGESEDVLSGELKLAYADDINASTAVGTYNEKTSASGLTSGNYDITYKKGNVTITKFKSAASAGTAKNNYLTVKFDKAIKGLSANNFTVKSETSEISLTSVAENDGGKSYTLKGDFAYGVKYTIEINVENENCEITGSPVTVTPARNSGGGSGSSGGSSGSSSSAYTVSFNTNGGSEISAQKVSKNDTAKMPEEPEKEGFVFGGWYTDKDLKTKYDFDAKVTENITLYAKWSEKSADNTNNEIILIIGEKNAKVFGTDKTNDVAPKIVNNRTMLPARFVAENLGATVEWDGENKVVTVKGKNSATGEDVTIIITIGSENAVVNGKEVKLDSPAFVENDRTYTPIRFISEELGADVGWFEEEQKVVITKLK